MVKPADAARPAAVLPVKPRRSRLRAALPLAPVAAGLLLLAAVIALGWLAAQALHGQERYRIAFADIDCTPPPHVSRSEFLDEVQYFAQLPDAVCVLDDGLPARLSAAFGKHPWVEHVQSVTVVGPRQVRVQLIFRTAVLVVMGTAGGKWAVDRNGVRLPAAAIEEALPVLRGDVPPPRGPEGRPWGDEGVEAGARAAGLLAPYQDQLHFKNCEMGPDGLALRGDSWRAHWGAPPGSEPRGETPADAKVRRLLDFVVRQGGRGDVDLSPAP